MSWRERTRHLSIRPSSPETEWLLGLLRATLVPLLVIWGVLGSSGASVYDSGFFVAFGVFAVYAACLLVYVRHHTLDERAVILTTALDITAIGAMAFLSGGAFSEARRAFVLIPILVAFRLTPWLTLVTGIGAALVYSLQALTAETAKSHANSSIVSAVSSQLWITAAMTLLSALLFRRDARIRELAEVRRRLLADVQDAEVRERRALAEQLHDYPIQALLSVRHDLEEIGEQSPSPAVDRADAVIADTVNALRNTIFDLHPYLLDEVGLPAAIRAAAERTAEAANLRVEVDAPTMRRHSCDQVLYSAARELLNNVVKHADATSVQVALDEGPGYVSLRVTDDGRGFSPEVLPTRLVEGHIGIASQRERIERVGGTFELASTPSGGTTADIRIPVERNGAV
jgi:two-component system NarL family sensor kinase